jgi:hypothetical protein
VAAWWKAESLSHCQRMPLNSGSNSCLLLIEPSYSGELYFFAIQLKREVFVRGFESQGLTVYDEVYISRQSFIASSSISNCSWDMYTSIDEEVMTEREHLFRAAIKCHKAGQIIECFNMVGALINI